MKIGIDHHPARTHWPGVGRYSRELVRALVRLDDAPEIALSDAGSAKRTIGEPALGLAPGPEVQRTPRSFSSGMGRRMFSALKRSADGMVGGCDLFHRMLPDWPPVAKAREVIAVSELFEPGSERDRALAACLARADAITFSDATGAELVRRYGLAPERIHRTPVGCDHWLRDLPADRERWPARKDPPQVLVLGAVHPRRRPERVLRAIEVLRRERRPVHVLYVGPRTDRSDAFLREDLGSSVARDNVLWNPNAEEASLARIFATSAAMIHLTEGEETAVTPLEGVAFGLPVLASRIPAFAQDLDGAARLLDPAEEEDPALLAGALKEALDADGPDARAARAAHAAEFTWRRCSEATLEVYRRVMALGA
jgi:glycosyltransferase involved in cell wall biosynthesis